MESGDPLISASALKTLISAPDVRVIDATYFPSFTNPKQTGREAWATAHIPGAVYFDIDEIADTASPLPHMMPDPVKFSARVRQMGIGDGHRIIVYDQNRFFASARVWWMLRYMGKTDVKVLDGGLTAWTAAGNETEDMPPIVSTRHFTPRVRSDLLVTLPDMEALVARGTAAILDARPAGRFSGKDPDPRAGVAAGHMPGSVNVPGGDLLMPDGRMKSADDLRAILPMRTGQIVATCGSGVTAAIIALGFARLGNWDAAVYDGSWSEWGADPARPIVKS